MARLIGAIIARDEETHLVGSLRSLQWADARLVLLDARTRDRSADVARGLNAHVVIRPFTSFPTQRNSALRIAAEAHAADWVLFVDADERVSASLAQEIRGAISREDVDAPVGYWIPRRNYIWGGWIKYGGWRPDHQLRLLRVGQVTYDERRDVHELAELRGPPGYLHEAFIHYNYDRIAQFVEKQRYYARLESTRMIRDRHGVRPHNLIMQPLREFWRRYVQLEGYRDGWRGLLLAALLAWFTAVTYAEVLISKIDGR